MTAEVIAGVLGAAGLGFSLRFCWWRTKKIGTPVLMYHQIGAHRPGSTLNKWRLAPASFDRQLDHLTRLGLRGISLRELLEQPESSEPRVVLTFDDGYASVCSEVLPRLTQRGFGATVFVVSERIGGVNDWDRDRPGEPLLTADEIRKVHAAGFEIGSHAASHRRLTALSDAELTREVSGSRASLSELLGSPIATFCYPYGAHDERVVEAVRSAGYRAATAIYSGISPDLSDPFRIRRVVVSGTDPFLDFRVAVQRGRSRLL